MTQPPVNPYGQPGPAEPYNPYASPPPGQAGYPQPGAYPGFGAAYPAPPVYGTPGAYPQGYQDAAPQGPRYFVGVGGLRVAVLVLSGLVVASNWLSAALAPAAKAAQEDAVRRGLPAGQVFTAYDAAGGLFLFTVAAWVVTCLWLQRVYQNAAAHRRYEQRRRAVWVWLGWFFPVVALWFPKQVLDDATRTTARAAGVSRGGGTGWWWAMWLLFLVLGGTGGRVTVAGGPGEGVVIVPELHVATALAGTIAFALWVPIVNRVSDIQDALAGRLVPGPLEAGPRIY